jgi:hypothetical protein
LWFANEARGSLIASSYCNWDGIDVIEEERALCHKEKLRKAKAISDLERTTLLEEVSWRQNSSALWLREDDKCTKFSTEWPIQIEEIAPLIIWLLLVQFLPIILGIRGLFRDWKVDIVCLLKMKSKYIFREVTCSL